MKRTFVTICVIVAALLPRPAWAIAKEDIPVELSARLPAYFQFIPPQVLQRLELSDLEEFAAANDAGKLYIVGEVMVKEHSGPLDPETVKAMLGLIPGIPFVEQRLERQAKQLYGGMMFSRLDWKINVLEGGRADVELSYASNPTRFWIPQPGNDPLGGVLLGVSYRDVRFKGESKSLGLGLQLNEDDPGAVAGEVSWTDSTLNGGSESFSIRAAVENQWRERLEDTAGETDFRLRSASLGMEYDWLEAFKLGGMKATPGIGVGMYTQYFDVYEGNPAGSPRGSLEHDGAGGYVRLKLAIDETDHAMTPKEGRRYSAFVESHVGDFEFTRFNADLRQYFPARNFLGYNPGEPTGGEWMDVRRQLPGASFGVQLQANVTDRDVPFNFETYLGDPKWLRGMDSDDYVGSKVLAARVEYRFAIKHNRSRELFLFSDHALLGEDFDEMESFSTIGLGGLFNFKPLAGMKVGAHFGTSLTGDGNSGGVSVGYRF